MKVFVCRGGTEDIASCIYDAWEWSLSHRGEALRIIREPLIQHSLFDEYVYTRTDTEKAAKVISSVQKKISFEACLAFCYGTLCQYDVSDDLYRFLQIGFREGKKVMEMQTEPSVLRILKAYRNVGNELHKTKGFARFDSAEGKLLVCHLEPKNHILSLLAEHFSDRMPSLHWMIIDDKRKLAAVHPADSEFYLYGLNEKEIKALSRTERMHDPCRLIWKSFFEAVSIKERENDRLQRSLFPLWARKHATEFRKP
ncbi:MAG: TIGR03915 family putative DNA repair protein [Johnsonella sp.]|nr:TIGR03915 family putative DNA repair protein [Johnsonella sp.]